MIKHIKEQIAVHSKYGVGSHFGNYSLCSGLSCAKIREIVQKPPGMSTCDCCIGKILMKSLHTAKKDITWDNLHEAIETVIVLDL